MQVPHYAHFKRMHHSGESPAKAMQKLHRNHSNKALRWRGIWS